MNSRRVTADPVNETSKVSTKGSLYGKEEFVGKEVKEEKGINIRVSKKGKGRGSSLKGRLSSKRFSSNKR